MIIADRSNPLVQLHRKNMAAMWRRLRRDNPVMLRLMRRRGNLL